LSTATEAGPRTGRAPSGPERLTAREWLDVFKRSGKQFMADDCMALSQQVAYSSLLAFFPAMIFFFIASVDDAWHAWKLGELSEQTAWRPVLWPFKAVVPISAVLLFVQGISEFIKSLHAARTGQMLSKTESHLV